MKLKYIFLIFAVLFSAQPSFAEDAGLRYIKSHGAIRCGTSLHSRAFAYRDDDKQWQGFDAEICKIFSSVIFGNEKYFELVNVPQSEAAAALQSGKVDVMLGNTPYSASVLAARINIDESLVKEKTTDDGILTVNDPCCGGGGMLIAALEVLKSLGVNYARNCFMEANDVDLRCVHMTYLQLALAGVPAIVRHQNTLTRECWSVWYTPAYLFQYLRFRKFDNFYERRKTHATA